MNRARFILILVNPVSGRGRALRKAEAVAANLRSRNIEVAVRKTSAPGDAGRFAHDAAQDTDRRPSCVVACGGDGTVQEVAGALAACREMLGDCCPALGLIPAGRCNDFARGLGISRTVGCVAEILATGRASPIDLGRVNGHFFCTVATVGIDAEVTHFVHKMHLPLRGTPAYLYGAIRVLCTYKAPNLRIEGDFATIDRPLFLASSANTASYGGAIRIAPGAVPNDGFLDLCVIDAVTRLKALTLIASVLRVRHQHRPEVQMIRTKTLTIDADRPLELWADGEPVATTPARVEIAPNAIHVLLPSAS